MGLHDIKPGLGNPSRRLIQNGKSAAKVVLTVAPGDELVVSEDVAAQLEAATPSFQPATDEKREVWDSIIEDAVAQVDAEQAATVAQAEASATPTPEPEPEPVKAEPAPAKKAAPKKAAAKRTDG